MADDEQNHETREGVGVVGGGGADSVARARELHHLATADPEPERGDGTLTGPAHEAKYGLERAEASAEYWRAVGVHPFENRALRPGDDGYVDDDSAVDDGVKETTRESSPKTQAVPPASATPPASV